MAIFKIIKVRCDKCHTNIARWEYMSGSLVYYCDDCVPRGCSCNVNPETKMEETDELGRFLPCCEYDYSHNGWTANYLLNKNSKHPKWVHK
jgi:hypothetical protein